MTKYTTITLLSGLVLGIISMRACAQLPPQKATFIVEDQAGKPIAGATVSVGFDGMPTKTEYGLMPSQKRILTPNEGVVVVEGGNSTGYSAFSAKKEGYYKVESEWKANRVVNRRWEPWNPTIKLQLKEIRKPIPMYALDTERGAGKIRGYEFPREVPNGPVGFDLMAHDWVEPYGKGKVADVVLECSEQKEQVYCHVLTMRFTNPNDGIIGPFVNEGKNILKSTHEAPVGPYKTEMRFDNLSRRQVVSPGEVDVTERWFAFRIRTVVDADGKVVSSQYGKFYGYPNVNKSPKAAFLTRLCYYINPTPNSRNLEWDQKTNMFTDLEKWNWPDNP